MTGQLNLRDDEIYGVDDPVTNKSAANQQYMDSKTSTFADGTTSISQVDIREILGSVNFFDDVIFHGGTHAPDIDSSFSDNAIVNKTALTSGGLIGANSFTPTLKALLTSLSSQKFDTDLSILVVKGSVNSHSVLHKDASLVSTVTLSKLVETPSLINPLPRTLITVYTHTSSTCHLTTQVCSTYICSVSAVAQDLTLIPCIGMGRRTSPMVIVPGLRS